MSISTKEQLRDYIHSIHDYLRNNGVGYGMTALKIFNVFYGLKLIEPIIDKTGLSNACKFSMLLKNAQKKQVPISSYITGTVLDELWKENDKIKFFLFHEIPKDLTDVVWTKVIELVSKIPTAGDKNGSIVDDNYDVDLAGKVYEYFVGRDDTAISEMGAYFTDRCITNYIMKKVNPKINEKDATIKTMIDPFGGSGGFTLAYTKYIMDNANIDWKNEIKKIYHYDMNEDVVKIAGLEMFGLTGVFPEKKITFKRTNTFTDCFENNKENLYFDYVFSNPPYGGDKNKKNATQDRCEKILNYLKNEIKNIDEKLENDPKNKELKEIKHKRSHQFDKLNIDLKNYKKEENEKKVNYESCSKRIREFANKYDLKKMMNDKEACSLALLMELLAKNGTCAGVLKEGVFFDGKYGNLRKVLLENYNVKYVISVPADQFENTSTKTSIVIFSNTKEKTKEVIFYDLVVEKQEEDVFEEINDEIVLVRNKGDIIDVMDKELCRASIDEICKMEKKGKSEKCDYSLDYKQYLKEEIVCPIGYKVVKLGDICKINPQDKKKDFESYNYIEIGDINSNLIVKYTTLDNKNVPSGSKRSAEKNDILLCSVRPNSKKIVYYNKIIENILLSGAIFILRSNDTILSYYIFEYLINMLDQKLRTMGNGSSYPRISPDMLSNFNILLPKDMSKLKPQLEKLQSLHKQISDDTEAVPKKEKAICDLIKKLVDDGEEGVDYDVQTLGDVCKLQDGYDFYRNEMDPDKIYKNHINYPLVKGNEDTINDYIIINKKYEKYEVNKGDLIIGTKGTCGNIRIVNVVKGYHKHGILKLINIKINKMYVYYFIKLRFDKEFISNNVNGSVLPHMNKETIENTKIQILKPAIMKKHKIEQLFDEVDKLKASIETNKKEYEKEIEIFMKPFTNQKKKEEIKPVDSDSDNESSSELKNTKNKSNKVNKKSDDDNSNSESEDEKPKKKLKKGSKKIKDDSSSESESEKEKPNKKKVKRDSDNDTEEKINGKVYKIAKLVKKNK